MSGQMKNNDKTNVMRILDAREISYTNHSYEPDASLSGEEIAAMLGEDADRDFKPLVTCGRFGQYYVFVVPVREEPDLKKGASSEITRRNKMTYLPF